MAHVHARRVLRVLTTLVLILGVTCPQLAIAAPIVIAPGEVLYCSLSPSGVRAYSPGDGTIRTIATGGFIDTPLGIAVESATSLLVTTYPSGRVVRIDLSTGTQSILTSGNFIAANPDGITMGLNGLVYVSELSGAKIIEVNPATGVQRLVTSANLLGSPIFMTPLSPTKLAVTSPGSDVVEVDIATGSQRVISAGGLLLSPQGIAVLPDGRLLVANHDLSSLVRVHPFTGAQTPVASGIPSAWGVSLDGAGSAYVTSYAGYAGLSRVNLTTGSVLPINTLGDQPFGVQVYLAGSTPPPPPPATPAQFSASDDLPTGIELRWQAVPEAEAYSITRDGTGIALLGSTATSYSDAPPVGTYEYCVIALSIGGESLPACDEGTRRGYLPEPRLQFVRDVPADQGSRLAIGWLASEFDNPVDHLITGYRVWRRLPAFNLGKADQALAPSGDGLVRARTQEGLIEYWEPILTIPAGFREGYGVVAETTRDSLAGDNPYTAYFVSALTEDPGVFYDSAVDSGYSVDNLAPPVPPSLGGAYLAAGGVRLSWRESRAEDLAHYEVYRGIQREFDPGHDALVGAPTDTTLIDPTGGSYHYKVLAVDVHGNRSAPALLSPLEIPTPAWILDADGSSDGSRHRLEVRLARDFEAREGTVYRSTQPDILQAEIVAERLAPAQPGLFVYEEDAPASGGTRWYWLRATGGAGQVALAGPIVIESDAPRLETAAFQPAPNPSRGAVSLGFVVGAATHGSTAPVRARVIDAAGRVIRDLSPGELAPGRHDLNWDGRNARGATVGAGVYRIQLTIGTQTFSRAVVIRS